MRAEEIVTSAYIGLLVQNHLCEASKTIAILIFFFIILFFLMW